MWMLIRNKRETATVEDYLSQVGTPVPKDSIWQELVLSLMDGKQAIVVATGTRYAILMRPCPVEDNRAIPYIEKGEMFWRVPLPLPTMETMPILVWDPRPDPTINPFTIFQALPSGSLWPETMPSPDELGTDELCEMVAAVLARGHGRKTCNIVRVPVGEDFEFSGVVEIENPNPDYYPIRYYGPPDVDSATALVRAIDSCAEGFVSCDPYTLDDLFKGKIPLSGFAGRWECNKSGDTVDAENNRDPIFGDWLRLQDESFWGIPRAADFAHFSWRADLVAAISEGAEILRDLEGSGHTFYFSSSGNLITCNFDKPSWKADHSGPPMPNAAEAVVASVLTYINYKSLE